MDRETMKSLAARVVDQDTVRSLAERAGLVEPLPGMARDLVFVAAGLGFGALFMYLLDPELGRRRRAQVTRLASTAQTTIGERARELSERAHEAVGPSGEAHAGGRHA
jgi:hypothetical protein